MRRLWIALAFALLLSVPVDAQQIRRVVPDTATGTVNAIDAGTCTATSAGCVVLQPGGYRNLAVQITGTCTTCTVSFEMSLDGTNWVAQNLSTPVGAAGASSTAAAGVFVGPFGPGIFRARLSARASGSFVITIRASL